MHQPYYRHPQTSEFVLPWVRLHASKDYLHMARLLQEFPGVKAHFTMVPSLRDQLEDYARGADDEDTRVTMRTVDGLLTPEERSTCSVASSPSTTATSFIGTTSTAGCSSSAWRRVTDPSSCRTTTSSIS